MKPQDVARMEMAYDPLETLLLKLETKKNKRGKKINYKALNGVIFF